MIGDFHFLRPEWLYALIGAVFLGWVVSRREDVRNRWRQIIAPELLDHLLVDPQSGFRVRPVHMTVAVIAIGATALAGPTWKRERPPFVEDLAPLAIAIDLSRTMDAIDVTPSRLGRAKLKVRDLLAQRAGARTAVFVYAGTAHMVLPLTDDAELIRTYVDSLDTRIMPVGGKNTAAALEAVERGLARETTPGTILFITDGVEQGSFDAFRTYRGQHELMVLGVGTAEGGPVKTGSNSYLSDSTGRRVFSRLDVEELHELNSEAGVPVATVTLDSSDVEWIQRRARTHLAQKQANEQTRWLDAGWWLALPIGLLAALWFRRGWTIRWTSVVLLFCAFSAPHPARAASRPLLDAFLTPDQQGGLYFERGDYAAASEHFADPMWKGIALYRASRFDEALDAFARVDTAESYYNQGNTLVHLGNYEAAVRSYQEALKRRPGWKEAQANLGVVSALIPPKPKEDEEEQQDPNQAPDEIKFDEKGKKGKRGMTMTGAEQTAEIWMRNIQTTPAQLLERKFAIEAQRQRH